MSFVQPVGRRRRGGLLAGAPPGVTCLGQFRCGGNFQAAADQETLTVWPDVEPGKSYRFVNNPCWAPENQTTISQLIQWFGYSGRGAFDGVLLSDGTVIATGSASKWAANEENIPNTFVPGPCGASYACIPDAGAAPPPPQPPPQVDTSQPLPPPNIIPAQSGAVVPHQPPAPTGNVPVYSPMGVEDRMDDLDATGGGADVAGTESLSMMSPLAAVALAAGFLLLVGRDRMR